jgi:hypothetical protein
MRYRRKACPLPVGQCPSDLEVLQFRNWELPTNSPSQIVRRYVTAALSILTEFF